MKKLVNHPSDVVREMLEGIARQSPHVAILGDEHVLIRRPLPEPAQRPVAVISGGGSGHEPAHGGYVGAGMLSAAVCGEVFTSPSTDAVLAAIRATAGPNGALLIVKNYTGDRLNFGLAAELARAEGIPVEIVVVADDVSLRELTGRGRRRGIAGTVLVHKLAGAAAERGLTLPQVAAVANEAAANLGTMGVALDGCTIPGVEQSGFSLADDEIELGLGIHGEKGVRRTAPMPANALAETLVATIVDDQPVARGDRVALLVNGLGATPDMELGIVLRAAYDSLSRRGVEVARAWAGTFLSALDMPGCSISLLKLSDGMLALLDAPTQARAWPGGGAVNRDIRVAAAEPGPGDRLPEWATGGAASADGLRPALHAVAAALIDNEPVLTELDSIAGDGDLGASMRRAANAILALPADAYRGPAVLLAALGAALRRAIAGSSGPFYATALVRAARRLADAPAPSARDWAGAFRSGVDAIGDLGGAKPGDRTMLDALVPAVDALERELSAGRRASDAWAAAVRAAEEGAAKTAGMTPRAGRASYLGARAVGSPDGGAVAVACWLRALQPHVA
ncbi:MULTISPECIES: dihydroxyacetone kinase family protein [Burkholderia]|uniref:dihydroxyacetone kinase family protein n=1 Tax=Burkholderia TaxID=32008 RepID=UPI0003280B30|nr:MULTISPECIES: dihydroxyacetone kinase family protein [Burkholderia]AGK48906.1 bifunctional ATP-dependent dihydroxyacetone kinase/FAD-AMP lyase [Burkholderia thailandensis MSMB121]ATF36881.1 dihydroxyacetone kinase subunit DhaK [Burkholderia thailandensis]KST74256.1 dihydroxyacetone kinase [Burkholderia humptydooensis]KVN14482.1 dihydroxyacetone kinase [Burkholderia sp. MSMB1552]KWZ55986.1 dihydroxyacetone kinase [Burkholderia sp. MSMB1588]